MKRSIIALLMLLAAVSSARAASVWDPTSEIMRLASSVPSIEAFHGAAGVVWLNTYDHALLADGSRMKRHREILVLSDAADQRYREKIIPVPSSQGARIEFECAAWHDRSDGRKLGDLKVEMKDDGGLRYAALSIPPAASGSVVCISYAVISPMERSIDDCIILADALPIWEEHVNITIPNDMEIYWEGSGILSPHRQKGKDGREVMSWSLLNEQAWTDTDVVTRRPPTLVFSVQRGLAPLLKALSIREAKFRAPSIPASISGQGGDLIKAGGAIHSYLRGVADVPQEMSRTMRQSIISDLESSWTSWEKTIVAARWFEALGFDTAVFWKLRYPVGANGVSSEAVIDAPVVKISRSGDKSDIFYTAGQTCEFGKLPPELSDQIIFRMGEADIERIMVPKGTPAENRLRQSWRMTLEESGAAEGRLDMDISGAWIDVFGLRDSLDVSIEVFGRVLAMDLPGMSAELKEIRRTQSGLRAVIDVKSQLGISSGSEILMRIPGAPIRELELLPQDEAECEFRFPFIFEQDAVVTTPAGYKAIMLPQKVKTSSSVSALESSVVHWPKRRQAEAEFMWTVKSALIKAEQMKEVFGQARQSVMWSASPIALRK